MVYFTFANVAIEHVGNWSVFNPAVPVLDALVEGFKVSAKCIILLAVFVLAKGSEEAFVYLKIQVLLKVIPTRSYLSTLSHRQVVVLFSDNRFWWHSIRHYLVQLLLQNIFF